MNIVVTFTIICLTSVDGLNVIKSYSQQRDDELVSVIALMRHGDRSPSKSFPNDKYFNKTYWPMGFKQLTNGGKSRQYRLGKWFRSRYSSLISPEYSPDDIYVFSTDTDRTLMSAAANLAGLYPPMNDQIWNPDLPWQPIPIHSSSRIKDDIITVKRECARFDKLYADIVNSAYYKRLNEQYSDLFAYVSEHSGWQVEDIGSIKVLRSLLYCEENYNVSYIPDWAKSLNNSVLDYLSGVVFQRYSSTSELKRLRTGPFFDHIFTHFDGIISSSTGVSKFLLVSGHDDVIVSVMDAMGVYDFLPPNFGAVVLWELRKNAEGAFFVNLVYRTSDDALSVLKLHECITDCPYANFKNLLEQVTVDISKWIQECSTIN